jgi:hypothetical protein
MIMAAAPVAQEIDWQSIDGGGGLTACRLHRVPH